MVICQKLQRHHKHSISDLFVTYSNFDLSLVLITMVHALHKVN